MSQSALKRCVILVLALAVVVACGPKETPEQRLERLRLKHEIYPIGTNSLVTPEGDALLLVDMQVTNHGTEPLPQLTVLIRVRGGDGVERVSERITLDLSAVRPGVGVQMDAQIPGVALGENDEVLVELESNLPADVLHGFPEWQTVAGGTS